MLINVNRSQDIWGVLSEFLLSSHSTVLDSVATMTSNQSFLVAAVWKSMMS